jgi:hypothetical protein
MAVRFLSLAAAIFPLVPSPGETEYKVLNVTQSLELFWNYFIFVGKL